MLRRPITVLAPAATGANYNVIDPMLQNLLGRDQAVSKY